MQTLGTEWGRALAPDFWVEAWKRAIERDALHASADGETVLIVVDDVRFPNEVAAIREMGGSIARIERPGAGLAGSEGDHASEGQDLGEADMPIVNDGEIDGFYGVVDRMVAGFLA
jgi:hypothetical protein